MYGIDMSPCRQLWLYSLILMINYSFVRSTTPPNRFNIILKTPGKTSRPTETPHKSVHVKHTLSNDGDSKTIIGFEPQIQVHQKAVEQLTVHLCDSYLDESIWYDDKTICDNTQSMLIYEWTPYQSPPLHIPADSGFELNKFKTIILTVIYKIEKEVHKERTGIVLYISTQPPRFYMGTITVGNQQSGTRFSCRSSNAPRLLYGVKKLHLHKNDAWWRIDMVRVRQFRRILVQSVFESEPILNISQNNIDIVSPDVFLMDGDYLLINCENKSQPNCYFLIYYSYKSKLIKNDNICQNNDFPNLFKYIPPRQISKTNQTTTNTSRISGSTIFLIVCILLIFIWISIIIGCIIMRRIRGLVNFRTESSPFVLEKNKLSRVRSPQGQFQGRGGDTDHIMPIDAEHAGHFV